MKIKVSVVVCTYNQEDTIARTLESILSQKTQYTYEIILGEDCSTDGTRTICEQYAVKNPSIITLLPPAPNKGLMVNYRDCINKCKGEYLMACAGDDWWHNERKIEMQVDFLERNPECVLSYTGCIRYNASINSKKEMKVIVPADDYFSSLIRVDFICAPTICFRKKAFDKINIDEYIAKGYPMEDYPILLEMSQMGKFHALDESTVTYTHNADSASTFPTLDKQIHFEDAVQQVRKDIVKKYQKEGEYSYAYLEDIYYRNLYSHGIKFNDRLFSYQSIQKVKKKNLKDIVKLFFASNPLTFSLIRIRNKAYATL